MVHGLAVQLKGDLRLSSQVGRGTRAELWLPASSGAVSRAPDETSDDGGLESEKIRVLVVDDDPLIASSTADMVADLGHSAIEADSGDRALDILQSDAEIELLLTDYLMPRMNGVELAKAAQRIRPRLATILATGYAEILGIPGVESGADQQALYAGPACGGNREGSQGASRASQAIRQEGRRLTHSWRA